LLIYVTIVEQMPLAEIELTLLE